MEVSRVKMPAVYPFFLQYGVQPNGRNPQRDEVAGTIATVMVFAETAELARARAGRHIGRHNWEIVEVKRGMLIQLHHLENMGGELKSLYAQAERAGIAAIFDSWLKTPPRRKTR